MADRTVEEENYVAVCASDNVSCGYDGGVELAEAAKAQGIDVKDLKVVELQGRSGVYIRTGAFTGVPESSGRTGI